MAWYRNHYHCGDCGTDWEDEWSCCCDDECPSCGSRNWSPMKSEDLTEIVASCGDRFLVLRSPPSAGHRPGYEAVATFETEAMAMRFVVDGEFV